MRRLAYMGKTIMTDKITLTREDGTTYEWTPYVPPSESSFGEAVAGICGLFLMAGLTGGLGTWVIFKLLGY